MICCRTFFSCVCVFCEPIFKVSGKPKVFVSFGLRILCHRTLSSFTWIGAPFSCVPLLHRGSVCNHVDRHSNNHHYRYFYCEWYVPKKRPVGVGLMTGFIFILYSHLFWYSLLGMVIIIYYLDSWNLVPSLFLPLLPVAASRSPLTSRPTTLQTRASLFDSGSSSSSVELPLAGGASHGARKGPKSDSTDCSPLKNRRLQRSDRAWSAPSLSSPTQSSPLTNTLSTPSKDSSSSSQAHQGSPDGSSTTTTSASSSATSNSSSETSLSLSSATDWVVPAMAPALAASSSPSSSPLWMVRPRPRLRPLTLLGRTSSWVDASSREHSLTRWQSRLLVSSSEATPPTNHYQRIMMMKLIAALPHNHSKKKTQTPKVVSSSASSQESLDDDVAPSSSERTRVKTDAPRSSPAAAAAAIKKKKTPKSIGLTPAAALAQTKAALKLNNSMVYLAGPGVYSCHACRTHLTTHDDIISKSFQGRHGRAFLLDHAVNVKIGPSEDRLLMTGLHSVCDLFCQRCQTLVGWTYQKAYEASQKYKEGKFIIEKIHLYQEDKEEEWEEDDNDTQVTAGNPSLVDLRSEHDWELSLSYSRRNDRTRRRRPQRRRQTSSREMVAPWSLSEPHVVYEYGSTPLDWHSASTLSASSSSSSSSSPTMCANSFSLTSAKN